MMHLLRAEWIKFRSVRSTWVLTGIAVVLALVIAGIAASADDGSHRPVETLAVSSTFVFILLLVLGIQFIGQEYRFGTIRATFTAVPNRTRVLVAKTMFGVAIGAATGARRLRRFVRRRQRSCSRARTARSRSTPGWPRRSRRTWSWPRSRWSLGIGIGAVTRNPALGIAAGADRHVRAGVARDRVRVRGRRFASLPFSASVAAIPGLGQQRVALTVVRCARRVRGLGRRPAA